MSDFQHPAILAARQIRMFVMDVDGVLTDGRLYYGNQGDELKAFNIQDGLGIKLLQRSGIETAIITGRSSTLLERRARELGIQTVIQGREDKLTALNELCITRAANLSSVAYMGDDLPDLAAIRKVGLGMCPANAHHYVAVHAAWQGEMSGGAGAVREAAEFILAAQGKLDRLLESYL